MDNILIIAGEIHNNTVIFLIISESPNNIRLYINGNIYCAFGITELTTRLLVPFIGNKNNYTFATSQNTIISTHNITNNYKSLIFLSCDLPAADTKHSLFNNFESQSGICFHLGDNIYGDKAYNSNNHNYKDIYINTWKRWTKLMSNFSHMMIADDHEVVDGFDIKHIDNSSNKKLEEALTYYHNFQTSLRYNPNVDGFFIKQVDDFTTVYCISGSVLNVSPIEIIRGLDQFTDNIIIATSSAPVPIISTIPYEQIFGDYEWKTEDLLELYDICFKLLESRKVKNVILIGGDLHFGISGIIRKGIYKIHVYVSSGISAHPTPIETLLSKSMSGEFIFGDNILFFESRASRNYLTIQLPIKEDNPGIITYSDEYWPISWSEYLIEIGYIVKPRININLLGNSIMDICANLY